MLTKSAKVLKDPTVCMAVSGGKMENSVKLEFVRTFFIPYSIPHDTCITDRV